MLGHWVARLGLAPLARLSREAQQLSPRQLSQRLRPAPLPHELSELTRSFNGALDRLEHAYLQLQAFNADVATQLRTPPTKPIGKRYEGPRVVTRVAVGVALGGGRIKNKKKKKTTT